MLSSIDFDDQTVVEANEVKNVIAVRVLASELAAWHLLSTQDGPELSFGICHPVAQRPLQRSFENILVRLAFHTLLFNPSPPNPPLEGEGFMQLVPDCADAQTSPSQ